MSEDRFVIRIGGAKAAPGNTLWIVRVNDKVTRAVFVQPAATRFASADEARDLIRTMIERGDDWAEKARPVRLVGKKTIKRG